MCMLLFVFVFPVVVPDFDVFPHLEGTSTQINRDRDKSWIGDLDLSRVLFIPVVWTWASNSMRKGLILWPAKNDLSAP